MNFKLIAGIGSIALPVVCVATNLYGYAIITALASAVMMLVILKGSRRGAGTAGRQMNLSGGSMFSTGDDGLLDTDSMFKRIDTEHHDRERDRWLDSSHDRDIHDRW